MAFDPILNQNDTLAFWFEAIHIDRIIAKLNKRTDCFSIGHEFDEKAII